MEFDAFILASDEIIKFTHCLKEIDINKLNKEAWDAERIELDDVWGDYKKAYKNYVAIASTRSEEEQEAAKAKHSGLHKTYLNCVAYIAEKRNNLQKTLNPVNNLQPVSKPEVPSPSIKVTPCEIKVFQGDYITWPTFRDMFTAIYVNNGNLSEIEKFCHLLAKTEGEAKEINATVPFTSEGFSIAWENLKNRYDNKRILINNQLRQLFNLPHCTHESANAIKRLQMEIKNCIAVLKLYQIDIASWGPIFIFQCSSHLPKLTLALWEQSITDKTQIPKWEDLDIFLTQRFQALESVSDMVSTYGTNNFQSKQPNYNKNIQSKAHYTKLENSKCNLCNISHSLRSCPNFLKMQLKDRIATVKRYKHCMNCLGFGHIAANCKSQNTCFKCQLRHHTLLHKDNFNEQHEELELSKMKLESQVSQAYQIQSTDNKISEIQSTQCEIYQSEAVQNHHIAVSNKTMLATAWINILSFGDSYKVRALIDPCSDDTFISEKIQKLLKIPTKPISADITGLGGELLTKCSKLAHFSVGSILNPNLLIEVDALVVTDVTGNVPTHTFSPVDENLIPKLDFADPKFYQSGPVDVLLGGNLYPLILLNGVRHGILGGLVAQETIFGWIITGPTQNEPRMVSLSHCTRVTVDEQLSKFWEIEEVPRKPIVSEEDKICEEIYRSTTIRNSEGRYVVNLPFRVNINSQQIVGPNRHIALRQFLRNEKTLLRKPEYKSLYDEVINEYQTLGHMEKVNAPIGSKNQPPFYLPHHGVFKPDSTTTKMRVVFNASSISSNGSSLNDNLYIGPILQQDLVSLILNWRIFKIVFNADITKMYRQILINPQHAPFQSILFRDSPDKDIHDFQLKTVTFGVNCAPYLAIRTLLQLANDEEHRFPIGSKILRRNMYVDDALVGVHDISEGVEARNQLIHILESAGFQLRKWTSNTKLILNDLPRELLLNEDFLCIDNKSTAKTLGIRWNASTDCFYFAAEKIQQKSSYTKREVLSVIAKLFDPAGWLSPVIVNAKIIMQQMWLDKIGWDEYIRPIALQKWQGFISKYNDINSITIPRWVHYSPKCKVEFHGFCDSSELAYAACLYVRIEMDDQIFTNLLVSKTKVAPLKKISLPRLELCGALLLSNLAESVLPQLEVKSYSLFSWSDSTIVIAWLRKPANCWTTFVANRVATIQEKKIGTTWDHVDTHSNPADLATRGLTPSELKESKLWWHGPNWLNSTKDKWPSHTNDLETNVEKREVKVHVAKSSVKEDILDRFSCMSRAIHVIAYILRFFKRTHPKLRTKFNSIRLSSSELAMSRNKLFQLSQQIHFPNEYYCLSQKKPLEARSPILTLTPFLDKDGIIRANGRLGSTACLSYHERHPIILAYGSQLARLYVAFIHKMLHHGGTQLTLATVRSECWILKARNLIKTHIHNCKVCVIHRNKMQGQMMAALPNERTTIGRPFTNTGVDFAGPFNIKNFSGRGCRITKGYVCLFVCFSTKAIHLEAVSDLTTSAFLAAFSRFVSRRGCPNRVYSDNGRNFVGAAKELKSQLRKHVAELQDIVVSKYGHQHLSWHFIPASAPHMGGLWEAGIKSCKTHLKKMSGQVKLTFEEFATLLASIEGCLNSRPLTPLSENTEDLSALTPGHFLIGTSLLTPAEPEELPYAAAIVNRWRRVKVLQQEFCRRWKSEYLKELHKRNKWKVPRENVKVNDLVVLRQEPSCPTEWRLGRIIKVYEGSDAKIRVADLKTQNGVITRPIHKLIVLP